MAYISVIIPVYNNEKYLACCIESVINQTLRELEIILIDDGSTDHSYDICNEYCRSDTRIIMVHKENKGLSSARNTGLRLATGKYLFFLDSDDRLFSSDSLYKMFCVMRMMNCDILIGQLYSEKKENRIESYPGAMGHRNGREFMVEQMKAKKYPGGICGNLYQRELFQKHDLFFTEGLIHEDEELSLKLFYYAEHIGVYKEYCYYRTDNPDSITKSTTEKAVYYGIAGLLRLSARSCQFFCKAEGLSVRDKKIILHRFGVFYLMVLLSCYKIKNTKYRNILNRAIYHNKRLLDVITPYNIRFRLLRVLINMIGKNNTIKLMKRAGRLLRY